MNWHRFHRLGIAVAAVLIVAACGSSSTAGATDWSKQASASSGGGMDALVAAAKFDKYIFARNLGDAAFDAGFWFNLRYRLPDGCLIHERVER